MQQYDYRALIEVYIQTQRKHIHPDFDRYYTTLLSKLEDAFGIPMSEKRIYKPDAPRQAQSLWQMFASAVGSYVSIRTPWDTFLESGALLHRLDSAERHKMFGFAYKISELAKESQSVHMELIYTLFEMMYGHVDTIVTSEDLLAQGFDDTTEPQLEDYYDEI